MNKATALSIVEKWRRELPEIWADRGRCTLFLEDAKGAVCALGAGLVSIGVIHPLELVNHCVPFDNNDFYTALRIVMMDSWFADTDTNLTFMFLANILHPISGPNDDGETNQFIYDRIDHIIASFKQRNSDEL